MKQTNPKRSFYLVLTLVMMIALTACGRSPASNSALSKGKTTDLTVFAAASMTETLKKTAEIYMKVAPGINIIFNFDSSGTLKTQIQEGAQCDLFISAAQKQMNELDSSKSGKDNPDGLDFIEQGTRTNFLENKVTLAVSNDNPKDIKNFGDMAEKLKTGKILMAMGNSDVPVGQYTKKILAYYNLDENALAKAGAITYGTNVKEVTTQIGEGSVACGVIYCTDAYSAGLKVVDTATAKICGQVIYPAAVLKTSKNKDSANSFLDYLQTDECMKIFEEAGFNAVP